MDNFNELCAICHENMNIVDDNEKLYELPECKHYYHTNCIVTWFRCGHARCPLCNNEGINQDNSNMGINLISNTLNNYSWQYRRKLLNENYAVMRRLSKKKNASKELKQKINKLQSSEQKFKEVTRELRDFMNSVQPTMTVQQLKTIGRKLRGKKSTLRRKIMTMKSYIGLSKQSIEIIIPTKVDVSN